METALANAECFARRPISGEARLKLYDIVGEKGVLERPDDLALYEYDGSVDKSRPDVVVFPRTTDDVAAIVKVAAEYGLPVVGRGAGTGLSGGAIPRAGGILIGFARMNRIADIDIPNERATVEPGVVNLDISAAVAPFGCFYAPDPSSQRACTIGGFDQLHFFTGCDEDTTRAEVRRCFNEAGEGGRFILSPSDHFFDANPRLIKAFAGEAALCGY